ncbi:uncharacterized protein I303_108647 [Kwoniella dejecticola CBS 10117]|uniref:Uncharacterized protein n=1 Tax=Kwoniella dejecticola CBS 10117 TaxID=1296121 RepID=A0A1A5ZWT5_9TREE|nr:uncharacterized protein I303_07028 [Kwoniella dejecticola CBS 10117]OBR82269.1 hypothetical protein I303_07028 [Kwoniella dejecticola CBS 10117]
MVSSMFSRPDISSEAKDSSTHRQKFRSISSFFHSTTTTTSSADDNELHVIAYRQPTVDSPARSVYDGLPSIRNASAISLSRAIASPSRSTASLRLKAEIHKEGTGVSYTSHTLQAQLAKDMPTLASAIHIAESSTTTTSRLLQRQSHMHTQKEKDVHPLYHINTSSASLLGSYVHIAKTAEGEQTNDPADRTMKRKLSRRLSLDNIVPRITGSLRKRERSGSKSSIFEKDNQGDTNRRWSLFSNSDNKSAMVDNKPVPAPAIQVNRPQAAAAMPVNRNWRNKFAVHKLSGELLGDKKEDLQSRLDASKQARERTRTRTASSHSRDKYDERTIKRVPVRGMRDPSDGDSIAGAIAPETEAGGRDRRSMISVKAGTVKEGQVASRLSFIHRPSSRASSFDPAATPKSTASSIPVPFVPTGPPLVESQTATSLAATFDSPSPNPRPLHTPLIRAQGLHIPHTARNAILSPAQDDRSILDPGRSPYPVPDASPILPSDGLRYQTMPLPAPPVDRSSVASTVLLGSDSQKGLDLVSPSSDKRSQPQGSSDTSISKRINHEEDACSLRQTESAITMTINPTQPSQTGTFGVVTAARTEIPASNSGQSHIEGTITSSSSSRTIYTLPRSKSKSHTDLSTYASSKNLVDHVEATQGPGWWSADKRTNRRPSTMYSSNTEQMEIEVLESLALSANLTGRAKLTQQDDVSQNRSASPLFHRMREEDKMRTRSSMDLRSSYRSTNDQGHQARPSLMAGSIWSKENLTSLPRRSLLSTDNTPTKSLIPAQIPLPPSDIKQRTFVSDRISPEIARRASFLNRASSNTKNLIGEDMSNESPSRSSSRQTTRTTGSMVSGVSTAPTSVQSEPEEPDNDQSSRLVVAFDVRKLRMDYEDKIESLKSRHGLEVETLLNALGQFKKDKQSLHDENERLTTENRKLKEKVKILCMSLQTMELGSGSTLAEDREQERDQGLRNQSKMKRSESVMSSLLPELINTIPISPLPLSTSTYDASCMEGPDEFGRISAGPYVDGMRTQASRRTSESSEIRKKVISSRNVSGQSHTTEESNILDDFAHDKTQRAEEDLGREGWTLSLKEDDERFLDDL